MIFDVDGKEVVIPPHIEAKLMSDVFDLIAEIYYKEIPKPGRIAMKHYSRKKLAEMEARINAQGGDGKAIRPADGEDPNLHYLKILLASSQGVLTNALLFIDTNPADNTATAFCLSIEGVNQAGGPLVFGGDTGERQDGGREDVRPEIRGLIPEQSALHL